MARVIFSSAPPDRLALLAQGRDNNWNLLRFLAAVGVIYTHSYSLALGANANNGDFLHRLIGISCGELGVNLFFVASGFLIAGSAVRRPNILRFLSARVARIYPGLVVSVAACGLILGPLVTSLDIADYFSRRGVYAFLVYNSAAISPFRMRYALPGVFEHLPWPNTVNGSLWTLPWEIWMYISIGILSLSGGLKRKFLCLGLAATLWLGHVAIVVGLWDVSQHPAVSIGLRLASHFYLGAACFLFGNLIVLSWTRFAACLGIAAILFFTIPKPVWNALFPLALAYIVFCLAFLPAGLIRRFNSLGDYSYGMYIYAYPIQQVLVQYSSPISPLMLFYCATALTLCVAISSWHLVEKPSLGLARSRPARTLNPSPVILVSTQS